jgi:hypothetical protein
LTSFTPFGAMLTFASTNRFVAGPLPPGPLLPDVERVTSAVDGVAPASPSTKCQIAVALAVKVAAVALLIWNEQVAVLPLTVGAPHVLFSSVVDGETLGVIDVSVAVVPAGLAVLVTVNVCAWLTSFTPLGAMLTLAFTNRFVTSPELPPCPFVSTWKVVPWMVTSAAAWALTVPAEFEVNETVQVPLTVPGPLAPQLSTRFETEAPPEGVRVTVAWVPSGAGEVVPPFVWPIVTVNVCVWPTAFTAFGAIEMFAPQCWNEPPA